MDMVRALIRSNVGFVDPTSPHLALTYVGPCSLQPASRGRACRAVTVRSNFTLGIFLGDDNGRLARDSNPHDLPPTDCLAPYSRTTPDFIWPLFPRLTLKLSGDCPRRGIRRRPKASRHGRRDVVYAGNKLSPPSTLLQHTRFALHTANIPAIPHTVCDRPARDIFEPAVDPVDTRRNMGGRPQGSTKEEDVTFEEET